MSKVSKSFGRDGEEAAVAALRRDGYRIIEQNFRNKLGEIDIIAKDRDVVCFVEVKSRKSVAQGGPFESISKKKMQKLVQLAQSYIKYKRLKSPVRFDVVGVTLNLDATVRVEILKNAFDLSYITV